MKCVIYANCQGIGLRHFLVKAGFPYEVKSFENYRLILGEQTKEDFLKSASECDLFIFQPTDAKYDELCAQRCVDNVLPKSARTLSFSYLFNSGIAPLLDEHGNIWGREYVHALMAVYPREQILEMYVRGWIDFGMVPRYLACAAEQARREVFTTIKMAEWVVDNRQRRPFFTFNHPTSVTFAEMATRVMIAAGCPPAQPITWTHWNECGLPMHCPISPYAVKAFGWDQAPDADAYECYRQALIKVLDSSLDQRAA